MEKFQRLDGGPPVCINWATDILLDQRILPLQDRIASRAIAEATDRRIVVGSRAISVVICGVPSCEAGCRIIGGAKGPRSVTVANMDTPLGELTLDDCTKQQDE